MGEAEDDDEICAHDFCLTVAAVVDPSAHDVKGIASHIKYHAEYSRPFASAKFGLKQAYVATAQSVRDTLTQRLNETYNHFRNTNGKAIHYLSMEYLQVFVSLKLCFSKMCV
jgi:hypothetical protein